MRILFIVLLFFACLLEAEEPIPENLKAQNGLYKNYVAEFLQSDIIKDANEVRLLKKLNEDESSCLPLLCYLGYIGKTHHQPFGSVQYPGQSSQPTFSDMGYVNAQFSRMKLHDYYEDHEQGVQIYVFCAMSGWPGMNNTCVVITTLQDYPLDWRGHDQSDMLKNTTYHPTTHELLLACDHRAGGEHIYTYKVHRFGIELVE